MRAWGVFLQKKVKSSSRNGGKNGLLKVHSRKVPKGKEKKRFAVFLQDISQWQ